MRQSIGFLLVIAVIGVLVFWGWKVVGEHGKKYGGQECGGGESVKCPAGYECVDKEGKTVVLGDVGVCRWQLGM